MGRTYSFVLVLVLILAMRCDRQNQIKNGEAINTAVSTEWETVMKDYLLYTS